MKASNKSFHNATWELPLPPPDGISNLDLELSEGVLNYYSLVQIHPDSDAMNTSQIIRASRQHPTLTKMIRAVCSSDQLPENPPPRPCAFVVNTDELTGPGKHWIALWLAEDGGIEMFDSYGRQPPRYGSHLVKFLDACSNECKYKTRVLQHARTRVCGQYCLYYLYWKCVGRSLESILDDFGIDKVQNDLRVADFVETNLPSPCDGRGQSCLKQMEERAHSHLTQKRVTFAEGPEMVTVNEWLDPEDKARKRQWHLLACGRMLFARRLRRAEKLIGPVFDLNHRQGWLNWYRHRDK